MVANFRSPRYNLRISGFLEGVSYLLLLAVAMPLKYFAGFPEAVKVVGMLHGILFIWFVLSIIWARFSLGLSYKNGLIAFIASLLPFGTFYVDHKILRFL